MVGVAGRDTPQAIHAFVVRHHLEQVPQAVDTEGRVWARLGISAQPAWIFLDRETGGVSRHFGALGAKQLDQMLGRLAS